jgi:hypothetical protein
MHPTLAYFRALEPNWDSYGADPISEIALEVADALIARAVVPPYVIAPICDGGVQAEWLGGGKRLEIEVTVQGGIEPFLILPAGGGQGTRYEERGLVSMDDALALVAEMADGGLRWSRCCWPRWARWGRSSGPSPRS